MKRIAVFLLVLPLLLFASLARAVPTVDAVQAEVRAGRYTQAESMMREVVVARPDSAKAHYVLAEILAHNGQRQEAAKEAAAARRLDPAIRFTERARFERFEQQLQTPARPSAGAYTGPGTGTIAGPDAGTRAAPAETQTRAAVPSRQADAAAAQRGSSIPSWLWLAGAALAAVVAWRVFSSRRAAQSPMAASQAGYPVGPAGGGNAMPGGVSPGYGYGPGMQQQPGMAPGRGPGLMGVGLGVAGGVAAGMLAERMLHGNEAHAQGNAAPQGDAAAGGLSPGVFDDASGADALRERPIDFGSGSSWDSGGDAGVDMGGSDGGGGGDDSW
jgi:hypothetical protein